MRYFFVCIAIFAALITFAQRKPKVEYDYALITNKKYKNPFISFMKNQPKEIRLMEGQKIIYQLKGKKEIKEGVITGVRSGKLSIDDKLYKFNKIEMIGLYRPGRWVRMLVGPVIIGAGAALIASGTYVAGYAIGTYLGESPFLFNLITINQELFVFKTFPGVLAATILGIGADMLGFHVGKIGVKQLLAPVFKDKFVLNRSKIWKLQAHKKEEVKKEEKSKTPDQEAKKEPKEKDKKEKKMREKQEKESRNEKSSEGEESEKNAEQKKKK